MTPTRLRECLETIGWTQRGLARMLGRQEGTVRQWARGAVQIPEDVGYWVNRVANHIEKYPPPKRSAESHD